MHVQHLKPWCNVLQMIRNKEKLQLLHISLLREYLALDLLPPQVAYSLPYPSASFSQQATGSSSSSSSSFAGESQETEEELLLLPTLNKQSGQEQDNPLCISSTTTALIQASERERVIDDFIIFCFLAGNDFLPHTFSTDVGERGLDNMIACYRRFLAVGSYFREKVRKVGKAHRD